MILMWKSDDEEYAPSVDGEVSDEGMAEGEVADDAGGFNDEVLLAHADSPSRGKKEQAPRGTLRMAITQRVRGVVADMGANLKRKANEGAGLATEAGKRMRGDDIGGLRPDWKKQVKRKGSAQRSGFTAHHHSQTLMCQSRSLSGNKQHLLRFLSSTSDPEPSEFQGDESETAPKLR
ncbi:hypothetical protein HGRIS_004398 [Hohenbuehelia grisea]|uniref:Uncharacterized protein n=1 Tax=Hohenbuehelia grisea TaxID=104357 RepID=A0ABR3JCC0_9AGAR